MDQQYQNIENDFNLVFSQLKNISKFIDCKRKDKKQSSISSQMNILNSNYCLEINSLLEYLDNSLMQKMKKIQDSIAQRIRLPKKQLSFCHNVFSENIQPLEKREQNSLKGIDSLSIFQKQPPQKSDEHSNIFIENLKQNKKSVNNQIKSAASKASHEADKENQRTKKLIQSDPQSNNFNKGQLFDQQIRGLQIPNIIFDTPLPKNKRIQLFNQCKQQDNYILQTHDQNTLLRNEDKLNKQKINQQQQNQNNIVEYAGSFNDRMKVDGRLQQFFKRNDINNFTVGSDYQQQIQFEDAQRYQSPNFNFLQFTQEDMNEELKNYSKQQTQQTILSRQTQNVRDLSQSQISKTMDFDSFSIKTREIDPIINGSDVNEFTDISGIEHNDTSWHDKKIIEKFNKYF